MSSTIKLYEHNQKAYDALLDMLGERDRACVIKPTGTGKFVIIAKMVQDNPDKRFLLLGTNDYMFNDQMANLAEIAPGFTPENLQFMTYSAAMMAARRGEEISGYDVVVADEFHHCGAEEWGKGVTHILDANESAKVVGFSATPIRYSDGGRNMADEMFDGNVAYSMELEEAWLRGILPIPEYIVALYNAPSELEKLAKSPTVFYQQLGRVLSSGGNRTPLVFDLCNNFSSITVTEGICSRMENTYREMKDAGEHPAFSPSDFKIVGKALEIKQLTGELRNALNRQVSVDDKITFLEEIAAQNGGKL